MAQRDTKKPHRLLPLLGAMRNVRAEARTRRRTRVAAPLRGDEEPARSSAVRAVTSSCCPS